MEWNWKENMGQSNHNNINNNDLIAKIDLVIMGYVTQWHTFEGDQMLFDVDGISVTN